MDELEALVILNSLPHIGSVKARQLLQRYGSAIAVLKAPLEEIGAMRGFGPKTMQLWKKDLEHGRWKQNLALAERLSAHLIPYTSPQYPKRLLQIEDHPLILYIKGELLEQDARSLAVVGTRQASIYGLEAARDLSAQLAHCGFTIVSGLARGIDSSAHCGALERGRTLAVLGSGLACLYPPENASLADAIARKGALISEFPMAEPPGRHNFPRRNRIVSGMTLGTIVIEAPCKSGAMLTAELALAQRRTVFALPGRADIDSFKGNHALIKQRKAELIENAGDVLKYFESLFPMQPGFLPVGKNSIPLESDEEELLKKLPAVEVSIEEIVRAVQWPVAKINSLLMRLTLKKVVKEYPGKIYKKLLT